MAVMIKQLFVCKNCGMGVSAQNTPTHCLKCKHKFDSDLDKTDLFWPVAPIRQSLDHIEFDTEFAVNKNEDPTSDVLPVGPIKDKIQRDHNKKYLKFLLSTDAIVLRELLISIEDLYKSAHGVADKNLLLLLIAHADIVEAQSKKLKAIRDSGSDITNYKELYS